MKNLKKLTTEDLLKALDNDQKRFSKIDFSKNLSAALNLKRIKFKNCDFSGSLLRDSHFYRCEFEKVKFNRADLTESRFVQCNFRECDFGNSVLNRVIFEKCSLNQLNLLNTQLIGTGFLDCQSDNFKTILLNLDQLNQEIIKNIKKIYTQKQKSLEFSEVKELILKVKKESLIEKFGFDVAVLYLIGFENYPLVFSLT